MKKLLIIIDAQNDFVTGTLGSKEAEATAPVIAKVMEYAEDRGFMFVHTVDTHDNSYFDTQEGKNLPVAHCMWDSSGKAIIKEARTDMKSRIIEKSTFGTLSWLNNSDLFHDVSDIYMCGFCTDICVIANFQILKAMCPEIPITIISDACAGSTPELHEAALKVMKACQARVKTLEEIKLEEQEFFVAGRGCGKTITSMAQVVSKAFDIPFEDAYETIWNAFYNSKEET